MPTQYMWDGISSWKDEQASLSTRDRSLIGKVERYFQWVSGPCADLVMWFEDLVCWWHCLGSWEVEPGRRSLG